MIYSKSKSQQQQKAQLLSINVTIFLKQSIYTLFSGQVRSNNAAQMLQYKYIPLMVDALCKNT